MARTHDAQGRVIPKRHPYRGVTNYGGMLPKDHLRFGKRCDEQEYGDVEGGRHDCGCCGRKNQLAVQVRDGWRLICCGARI